MSISLATKGVLSNRRVVRSIEVVQDIVAVVTDSTVVGVITDQTSVVGVVDPITRCCEESCMSTTDLNHLAFHVGDTHVLNIQAMKPDPTDPKGVRLIPLDITNGVLTLTAKARITDSLPAVQLAGVIIDAVNGKMRFTFIPASTATLKPGQYIYDVKVALPGTIIYTIIKDVLDLLEVAHATP